MVSTSDYYPLRDKSFMESLLWCFDQSGPEAKCTLLYNIAYILGQHVPSREVVHKSLSLIKPFVTVGNPRLAGAARNIMEILAANSPTPVQPTYFFAEHKQYDFHQQYRQLVVELKREVWIVDNYADESVLDYLHAYGPDALTQIRILTGQSPYAKHLLAQLQVGAKRFKGQHPVVSIEVRSTNAFHDRFLVQDAASVWNLGPSLRNAGKKTATMHQLDGTDVAKALGEITGQWNSATHVFVL